MRPIIEFPTPSEELWEDPPLFHEALDLHMRRHGETAYGLRRALVAKGYRVNITTLRTWRVDLKAPSHRDSFAILRCLEERWRLPPGYFQAKLPQRSRAMKGHKLPGLSLAERRRLAWHLPDDFSRRPQREREEILDWVRRVIISGATDYRRYQVEALKRPFGIRFPELEERYAQEPSASYGPRRPTLTAPPGLAAEMAELLAFKTATLTRIGYERHGVWGNATAGQRLEHFGLLFGALAAPADGELRGAGVPHADLSFALLVFPEVWDWYLRWREGRRGFYTRWETDMLANAAALANPRTGWMTQTPDLAARLRPLAGLVTDDQVTEAWKDWTGACACLHEFARARMRELKRVTRVHHDPFEPILPVLEADSPIAEYLKIADEVLRLAPCARRYPRAAAESARAYLMIRLGLHLGFRQKNLRQLLVCRLKEAPTPERQLDQLRRGELRWSSRDNGWEVFVPLSAFKNASSSFFGKQPFRLILPDLGDLYAHLDRYIERHRHVLLGPATDPGTLFVKSVKISSAKASYNSATFYEAWRLIIQRYGVFNPYTGRGAIEGLLPHGPHSVRDVLATHVLKQTGSYEQASYAIQDTPEMVANHYGRFLPQDKAAIAAQVLNRVWEHR